LLTIRTFFGGVDLLAIDEAQSIPDIGMKLKLIVDEIPGIRVLASGSSSFDLLNRAGEPLVGRSTQFILSPFSQQELSQKEDLLTVRRNLELRMLYGAYPEVVAMDDTEQKIDYLRDIVGAYLLKDILAVDGIKNSEKMRELLRMIAFQVGNEVSYDEIGSALGMSKNTVERYLDLLSKVFVVFRLGAYANNLRKEVSKAGKWYFCDNGIRNSIISDFRPLSIRQDAGALWENYLISERFKIKGNYARAGNMYFWRTFSQQEVDLVEVENGSLQAFEFKWGSKMPAVPSQFISSYPDASYSVINRDNYLNFIGL
jgi:predicted AAA+ superfamily ATPase